MGEGSGKETRMARCPACVFPYAELPHDEMCEMAACTCEPATTRFGPHGPGCPLTTAKVQP